jgi:hypothetical protein
VIIKHGATLPNGMALAWDHLLCVVRRRSSSGLWAVWATRSVFQGVWKTHDAAPAFREEPRRLPHPVTVHRPSACGLLRLSTQALTQPKRLADEFQEMRAIREPLQQGRRPTFVAKDLGPIGNAHMGGDDQGHPFVQGRAELQQQMRPGGGEGDEAQLVHDDQVRFERGGQDPWQPMVILCVDQLVDQSRGSVASNLLPVPAGRQRHASREVRVPQARVAEHEDRLGLLELRPPRQFEDLGLGQLGQARAINVGQRL